MALTRAHNRMIDGAAGHVADFGAVGDGVTDDTAAIQAALDWHGQGPHKHLEFGSNASYRVTETLTMTSLWTQRKGLISGNNATITWDGGTSANLFDVSAMATTVIRDLRLRTNSTGVTAIYSSPNGAQYAGQAAFYSIEIIGFETGFYRGSDTGGNNGGWSTNFYDLDIQSCTTGIHLADGGNNALLFSGARVATCDVGVLIDSATYSIKFVGGVVEFNDTAAFQFSGTSEKFAISIDQVYMENACTDFKFDSGFTNVRNLTVQNCYIFSNSATKADVIDYSSGSNFGPIAFRDNFIYTPQGNFYGTAPDDTILDGNYSDFTNNVGGLNLQYVTPGRLSLPNKAAGVKTFVDTTQKCLQGTKLRWTMYHNNNDGNYFASGIVVVSQDGNPKTIIDFLSKSGSVGTDATGTLEFVDNGSGVLRFEYTPPGIVTTAAGSYITLSNF